MTLPALADGDLGTDLDLTTDLGLRWNLVTGNKNLGRALARRLSTPRGALPWDPNYGFDLRDSLNAGLTQTQLSQLRGAVSSECEKDERVLRCDADVSYNARTSSLTVGLTITTATGPFSLILLVTAVTVDLLNANLPTTPIPPGQVGATINIGITGPPGPAGAGSGGGGGGGGGGSGSVDLTFPKRMGSNTGGNEIVGQVTMDFNLLPAGSITADLTGYANSVSGTAIVRLYVGGTPNVADGTLVGSTNVTSVSDVQIQIGATLTNPTGVRIVKLAVQSSGAGVDAQLADTEVSFH